MRVWIWGILAFAAVVLVLSGCASVDEVIYVDNPIPPKVGVISAHPTGSSVGSGSASTGSTGSGSAGNTSSSSTGSHTTSGGASSSGSAGSSGDSDTMPGASDSDSESGGNSTDGSIPDDEGPDLNTYDLSDSPVPVKRTTTYDKDKDTTPVKSLGTKEIVIKDLKFIPSEITIPVNTTVIWKNAEDPNIVPIRRHRLSQHYNEFRSWFFDPGQSYNYTFRNEGVFTYIDVIYPERMRGKITVVGIN